MPRRQQISLPRSFYCAGRGFWIAVAGQRNLRLHLVAALIVIGLAAWLRLPLIEWMLLWFCLGSVLTVELINTAIEAVVDLASPGQHELAGKAKDIAAAAVLIVSAMSAVVGAVILLPPLLERFSAMTH